ncbi:MAG: AraC family transcriptional regulator [Rubrobacter sp.]
MSEPGHERLLRGEVFSSAAAPVTANRHLLSGDHVPHDHDFVEVAVVFGGRGTHRTIHGDQPVTSGDAFVLKPGVWHAYRGCLRLEVYNCCFGPELLGRELAWVAEDPALTGLLQDSPGPRRERGISRLRLPPASLESCRRHLEGLNRWTPSDPARARLDGVGRLLLFLGALALGLDTGGPAGGPAQRVHRFVAEGVRRLEADPARRWSLGELSGELSVDGSYLARLFKSGTGLPPIAYLNRHRAELAANLLLRTDLPVSRVGERVGWHDPNYFARRFKAHFGVSATAYRARMGAVRPGSTAGT